MALSHNFPQSPLFLAHPVDILTNVSVDWNYTLREILLYSMKKKYYRVRGKEISWSLRIQFPMCQTIDLSQYFDLKKNPPKQVIFKMNVIDNMAVSLSIVDRLLSLNRTLKSQVETYNGPPIQHNNMAAPEIKRFALTVTQTLNSEADRNINCTNYPNDQFSSFRDCDERFVLSDMRRNYDGIMPFWATRDFDQVTRYR